jgi:serine protease
VDASSVLAGGTWKLRVSDGYTLDTGCTDSWSLQF